jgi:wobble nucleotide-excising tRNase
MTAKDGAEEKAKELLIANIKTKGWYPNEADVNEYTAYSKDSDVLDALVERWNEDLMQRKVLSNPADAVIYRLRASKIRDRIEIVYSQADSFGWTITCNYVDSERLFKGTIWRDLQEHDRLKTPPAKGSNNDECCTSSI